MVKIAVKGNRAALLSAIDLVANSVGEKCRLYLSDDWYDLKKQITYKAGNEIYGPYTMEGNDVDIPAIVFAIANVPLEIGITGYSNDRKIIKPTVWCPIGFIRPGALNPNTVDPEGEHIIYDGGVIV